MSRICMPVLNVGPEPGQTQLIADQRICKSIIGVGPIKGETVGNVIIYGTSGVITYGTTGPIIY